MIYNILYIEYTIGYHSGFTWPHQCGWAAGSERVRLIGITEFSICVQSILNFHCVLMGWWFSILVLLEQSLRLYHFMHGLACGLAVSCGTTYNTNLGLRPNCQHTFRPDILPSNKKLLSDISPKTDVYPNIATQAGSDVKKHSTFRTPHPSASLQKDAALRVETKRFQKGRWSTRNRRLQFLCLACFQSLFVIWV